jgi:hypothetical protein
LSTFFKIITTVFSGITLWKIFFDRRVNAAIPDNIYIVVIPGLQRSGVLAYIFSRLQHRIMLFTVHHRWGFQGEILLFNWLEKDFLFDQEIERLHKRIRTLFEDGKKIVLVGTSAGASVAINLLSRDRWIVSYVINIAGRVREGDHSGRLSLDKASRHNRIFEESVLICEDNLKIISSHQRRKIMTIRPLFDEVVPADTVSIAGATNKRVWCVEHGICIFAAAVFMRNTVLRFISQ